MKQLGVDEPKVVKIAVDEPGPNLNIYLPYTNVRSQHMHYVASGRVSLTLLSVSVHTLCKIAICEQPNLH